ncbi:acetyl-CoA acetyltransferase [Sulfodiicoccus acidiphilus]|uniref:Acetyl-CoA acetyltransferase n=1 Tax=Sulfodiicoccus acidiphilus TaxID=1670455 RepID=A0A348B403_9CREN|nr:thiolase domain-containing protein [Sulfodiicoccus acidiphilus]BBD72905.1 acetyl-CoA acetyltransferase [Sulfodiicoccus acidiphilus]GGT88114.1 acetyl-CoA acetyltransferase [Sulfodiicoccus acidiphilus]
MERKVAVVGYGLTKFGRRTDASLEELAWEAGHEAIGSAGLERRDVRGLVVSNVGMWSSEELPAVVSGEALGVSNVPTLRVEAACASGSSAIHTAYSMIASGRADVVLALGVEKMHEVDTETAVELIGRAGNYKWEYEFFGLTFPGYYALHQTAYMKKYDAREEDFALVSVKNHGYAQYNPYAQFRNPVTVEEVMRSKYVAWPVKLLDSSPITDGAAAVVLASANVAKRLTDTPVWVTGLGAANGTSNLSRRKSFTSLEASVEAARQAYSSAGIDHSSPWRQLDVATVHDCFTVAEVMAYEDLNFAARGEGIKLLRDGQTQVGGRIPVNLDGGLKAKGHPIGATGVAMAVEATKQLLRKAEKGRQADIRNGRALTHNVGGTGHYAYVTIYEV